MLLTVHPSSGLHPVAQHPGRTARFPLLGDEAKHLFPVRYASGLRRSDHHRDLAKQLNARRDAVLQPPEKVFLMRFSQFAGNTKFPRTEHGMGRRGVSSIGPYVQRR